mgnify:CR=1 FL=1
MHTKAGRQGRGPEHVQGSVRGLSGRDLLKRGEQGTCALGDGSWKRCPMIFCLFVPLCLSVPKCRAVHKAAVQKYLLNTQ